MSTIQSIGSPLMSSGVGKPASTGALESRLSRYEIQLSDWCHCPSGKTAEGKRKIADLQQKADAIKDEIKQVEAARSGQRVSASTTVTAPQSHARAPSDAGIDVYA